MSEMKRIITYGTLKKKHGNHGILGNARFIGVAITVDKFNMFDGGFPFVSDRVHNENNLGRVVGELYETDRKDILDNLDRLEGVPYLYVKREVDVTTLDGVTFIATIYVASEGSNDRLTSRETMKPVGQAKLLEWR